MKKIKVGIVGAGWVARKHLEAIKGCNSIEVSAISSRTKSKAEDLRKEFDIPRCSNDLGGLIKETRPDALMILVSADQTYKVCKEALEYQIPLFIEKPAGLNPQENLELFELARKKSILNMVGFNRRFYSLFHKGINIIKQHGNLFGVYVEAHERMWKIRQNPLVNKNIIDQWFFANSIHCVDLLRFFGGDTANVKSITRCYREKSFDQMAAIMELSSGAIGQYSAHWYSPGGWKVVLYGDGVTVEFKPLEKGIYTDKDFNTYEISPDQADLQYKGGFLRQAEAFAKLVSGGKKEWPIADLEDSLKTYLLAQELLSATQN